MHLDVKNCASHCCPLRFLGTILHKYFYFPILQSVSNERFPSSCSLHQQPFWLLIFDRIKQVLLLMLCCHLSMVLMVVCCAAHIQQGFCLQKIFCASESLVLLTLHHLQRPAKVFCLLRRDCYWECIHTAARCSMLPFPWKGSQTCPDTSSTYSTLRHFKAMPLQVGMDEGPRSKAVCVSRLQYCQYS